MVTQPCHNRGLVKKLSLASLANAGICCSIVLKQMLNSGGRGEDMPHLKMSCHYHNNRGSRLFPQSL
jgi:hypothetical protein